MLLTQRSASIKMLKSTGHSAATTVGLKLIVYETENLFVYAAVQCV